MHLEFSACYPCEYPHEPFNNDREWKEEPYEDLIDRSDRECDTIIESNTQYFRRNLSYEEYDHECDEKYDDARYITRKGKCSGYFWRNILFCDYHGGTRDEERADEVRNQEAFALFFQFEECDCTESSLTNERFEFMLADRHERNLGASEKSQKKNKKKK